MRIEMRRLDTHGAAAIQLGANFGFHFFRLGRLMLAHVGPQASLLVDQAGHRLFAGQRTPAILLPFRRKRDMNAGVDRRMLLDILADLATHGHGNMMLMEVATPSSPL